MKKAQVEMMGLVILVILITISLIFLLKYLGSKEKEDYDINIRAIQAENLQLSLDKAYICEGNNLEDAFIACCNKETICNKNACDLLKEEVPKMVELVLPGKKYNLLFKELNDECFSIKNCEYGESLGPLTIKRDSSRYSLNVLLCTSD